MKRYSRISRHKEASAANRENNKATRVHLTPGNLSPAFTLTGSVFLSPLTGSSAVHVQFVIVVISLVVSLIVILLFVFKCMGNAR